MKWKMVQGQIPLTFFEFFIDFFYVLEQCYSFSKNELELELELELGLHPALERESDRDLSKVSVGDWSLERERIF